MEVAVNETTQRTISLKEKLCSDNIAKFFGLTLDEISDLLKSVNFTGGGGFRLCFFLLVTGAMILCNPKYK